LAILTNDQTFLRIGARVVEGIANLYAIPQGDALVGAAIRIDQTDLALDATEREHQAAIRGGASAIIDTGTGTAVTIVATEFPARVARPGGIGTGATDAQIRATISVR